ncbi:MAG: BlaI/MecI/CopY family transcriptional regulator [Desulfobacteraceae bacterium]|jgi:predicted transcriptional regulator
MPKDTLPRLTPAEFDIMDAVWNASELTVTEILNEINSLQNRDLKRATIQVQVGRLEEKGWLKHRQEGNKFIFKATVPRSDASAFIAFDIGKRVFGGSCVELLKAFFSRSTVSPEEIRQLRELIDKYEE